MIIMETLTELFAKAKELEIFKSIYFYLLIFLGFLFKLVSKEIKTFFNEIVTYYLKKIRYRLYSIFKRDKQRYNQLALKYVKPSHIGGLKDQLPYNSLGKIYINVPCGIVNNNIIGGSSLVDNLSEIPITDRRDVMETLYSSEDIRVLTLLGGPGAGKTTLFCHLLESILQDKTSNIVPIPLIVRELGSYFVDKDSKKPNLLELIRLYFQDNVVESQDDGFPHKWLARQLKNGQCLIFVDGIDELETDEIRVDFLKWLENEIRRFNKNKFLITSRPHGVKGQNLQFAVTRYLCPLSREEIKKYIDNWYEEVSRCQVEELEESNKAEKLAIYERNRIKSQGIFDRINNTKALGELAERPMILVMMLIVHITGNTLPERRCSLFDRVMTVMLGGRNDAKDLSQKVAPEVKLALLAIIAGHMVNGGNNEISMADIRKIANKHAQDYSKPIDTDCFIWEVVENSGLLLSVKKDRYAFCHNSFRDYLAACYLLERFDQFNTQVILKLALKEKWFEPLLLLAGQMDATSIVESIIHSKNKHLIEFLIYVLIEAQQIKLGTRKKASDYIKKIAHTEPVEVQALIGKALLNKRLGDLGSSNDVVLDTKAVSQIEFIYYLYMSGDQRNTELLHKASRNGESLVHNHMKSSKHMAENFCHWVSKIQGDGWVYRLPRLQDISDADNRYDSLWIEDLTLSDSLPYYNTDTPFQVKRKLLALFKRRVRNDTLHMRQSIFRSQYGGSGSLEKLSTTSKAIKANIKKIINLNTQNLDSTISEALYLMTHLCAHHVDPEEFSSLISAMNFQSVVDLEAFIGIAESKRKKIKNTMKDFNHLLEQAIEYDTFNIICGKTPLENAGLMEKLLKHVGITIKLPLSLLLAEDGEEGSVWLEENHRSFVMAILAKMLIYTFLYTRKEIKRRQAIALYLNLCVFGLEGEEFPELKAFQCHTFIVKDANPRGVRKLM